MASDVGDFSRESATRTRTRRMQRDRSTGPRRRWVPPPSRRTANDDGSRVSSEADLLQRQRGIGNREEHVQELLDFGDGRIRYVQDVAVFDGEILDQEEA